MQTALWILVNVLYSVAFAFWSSKRRQFEAVHAYARGRADEVTSAMIFLSMIYGIVFALRNPGDYVISWLVACAVVSAIILIAICLVVEAILDNNIRKMEQNPPPPPLTMF